MIFLLGTIRIIVTMEVRLLYVFRCSIFTYMTTQKLWYFLYLIFIWYVAPVGHNILIPRQPISVLSPQWCVLSGETANINYIVFGITPPGLEPTIYRTRGEHAIHYTTDEPTIYCTRDEHDIHYTTDEPTIYRTRGEHAIHYITDEPTIYRTRGEHAIHYTTDGVQTVEKTKWLIHHYIKYVVQIIIH